MDSKHTPGPWEYRAGEEAQLVSLGRNLQPPFDGPMPVMYTGDIGGFIEDADGVLAAAAPDLLAALEALLSMEDWEADDAIIPSGSPVGLARAAIAKAKGE